MLIYFPKTTMDLCKNDWVLKKFKALMISISHIEKGGRNKNIAVLHNHCFVFQKQRQLFLCDNA
jgi:hypothetical protein